MAILLFTIIESWLFRTGRIVPLSQWLLSFNWLIVVGALMLVSWLATHVSLQMESKPLQYLALAGFVAAEAVIFAPMLLIAAVKMPGVIEDAAQITVLGCFGLTAVAFITRKDFSFLRGVLVWAGILALVAIVCGVLFGFQLGTWFSIAMIGFAGGAVLYDTSNIIHHYPEDRYVGAALALFSSIILMFWYVLRLLMSRR
jgi:FtsH-binding integral membrane protein